MTVSIGLPFASVSITFFELAVRSVFAQTHQRWELLLFADGAPEDVLDRAASIRDPRVSLTVSPISHGLAQALNDITRRAQHPLVARMDADDVMLPDRLEKGLAHLNEHPEVDVLASRAAIIDEYGIPHGALVEQREVQDPQRSVLRNPITHPTVIARRAWFEKHPYSPEWSRTEDKQLWQTAPADTRFVKLDEMLLAYRIPRRIDTSKVSRTRREDRRLLRRYGPSAVGPLATARGLALSHAGEIALKVASAAGQNRRVYEQKCEHLDAPRAALLRDELARVGAQQVPGW